MARPTHAELRARKAAKTIERFKNRVPDLLEAASESALSPDTPPAIRVQLFNSIKSLADMIPGVERDAPNPEQYQAAVDRALENFMKRREQYVVQPSDAPHGPSYAEALAAWEELRALKNGSAPNVEPVPASDGISALCPEDAAPAPSHSDDWRPDAETVSEMSPRGDKSDATPKRFVKTEWSLGDPDAPHNRRGEWLREF